MRSKKWVVFSVALFMIGGLYFLGPRPHCPVFSEAFPSVPQNPRALEVYIEQNENQHHLKRDNEARIIWQDSTRKKTEYAVVYLHGFSASQKEGDPVHRKFAAEFGCNLFLPRLSDHGIDTTESLLYFTADRLWESAKEALAIGENLGEKVILVSTSTGGTLALMLAAIYPDKVHALINLSPNIAINNPASFLLNDPWGLYIARMVMAGKYRNTGVTEEESQYWNREYRLESLVQLQDLIESSMDEKVFRKVRQPSLTLYYYKNEEDQDPQVKVSAMLDMHQKLGTPNSLKVIKPVPGAGAHVIGSSLTSKDVAGVYNEMRKFAVHQLKLHTSGDIAYKVSRQEQP